MERRRQHVLRKRVAQPVPQRGGIEWPVARVEGHQALAAARSLGDDDRGLAHSWHLQQCVFDLADLDSEAPDLHLGIPAAKELQLDRGQGPEPALYQLLLQRLARDRNEPQVWQLVRLLLSIRQ